jgi:hypothetical protein
MNTEQAKPADANSGHDDLGRFVMNNKGGPGNPFARQVAALRQALLDSITPDDIQDVATRLLALAKEGNVQAAKLLLAYTIGKPQPAPEPDRLDADEWQGYKETQPMKKESAALMNAGDPFFHLNMVRTTRPILTEMMRQQIRDMANETSAQREAREAAEAAECERILRTPTEPLDFLANRAAPSPNGINGSAPPSTNGKKRPSPKESARFEPSPNGKKRFASANGS